MVVTYCSAADVVRYLGLRDEETAGGVLTLSTTTSPTLADMESLINDSEDEIDEITHHAWREVTRTAEEFDAKPHYIDGLFHRVTTINLPRENIRTFDTDEGDSFEYWDESQWVDYLTDKTAGSSVGDQDYYVDYTLGIIYISRFYPTYGSNKYKLTYRHGESSVPRDVKRACVLLTAANFLTSDLYLRVSPDNTRQPNVFTIAEKYETRAYKLLDHHIRPLRGQY